MNSKKHTYLLGFGKMMGQNTKWILWIIHTGDISYCNAHWASFEAEGPIKKKAKKKATKKMRDENNGGTNLVVHCLMPTLSSERGDGQERSWWAAVGSCRGA